MASQQLKTLTIKTNIVSRITKELQVYRDEERLEKEKVQKLKENGADPYDIKFAENIMNESIAMVPDAEQRLKAAIQDLNTFLEDNVEALHTNPTEGYEKEIDHARQALSRAESHIAA